MFVSADRPLGISFGVAQARLANLIRDDWLSEASRAAFDQGMDHLLRVGPLGELPGASRLVRVRFVDPLYRKDTMTVGLRWETTGRTAGLFPVLDADITLSPGGGEGSRVAITGCYRAPFGPLGAGLDRLLMRKVAVLTIKSLLTRLASSLELTAAAPEHAAGSWLCGAGPQTAIELCGLRVDGPSPRPG